MLTAFCIVFLAFLCLYEPLWGYKAFRQFRDRLQYDPGARLQFYKAAIIGLWFLALAIGLMILTGHLAAADTGLSAPGISTVYFSRGLSLTILGLAGIYTASLLYQWLMLEWNPAYRRKMAAVSLPAFLQDLLPVSPKEKRAWFFVSATAGITEEFIYRGFLFFCLGFLFPNAPVFILMLSTALLFGLGHTYQGTEGVLKTTLIGFFYGAIYLACGSILPVIILHFIQDFMARHLGRTDQAPGC